MTANSQSKPVTTLGKMFSYCVIILGQELEANVTWLAHGTFVINHPPRLRKSVASLSALSVSSA